MAKNSNKKRTNSRNVEVVVKFYTKVDITHIEGENDDKMLERNRKELKKQALLRIQDMSPEFENAEIFSNCLGMGIGVTGEKRVLEVIGRYETEFFDYSTPDAKRKVSLMLLNRNKQAYKEEGEQEEPDWEPPVDQNIIRQLPIGLQKTIIDHNKRWVDYRNRAHQKRILNGFARKAIKNKDGQAAFNLIRNNDMGTEETKEHSVT